jgi:hypothetical protein
VKNPILHDRFIEWVSDYCIESGVSFDADAVRTFGQGLTEGNFDHRFSDLCGYLHDYWTLGK